VIDYNNILQKNRNQLKNYPKAYGEYYTDLDWVHINSIDFIGDNVVISSRNQSTVVCNDQEGNIKWMLCDPAGYNKQYKQYMLKSVGKNFFWPYTQHAADVLPDQDGNPDTVDILLFDNGNFRLSDKKKASHMIQYRINEKEMTVQLIWSWGEDRKELYSMVRGDADLLENGNRLGSFEPRKTKKQVCYAHGVEVDEQGEPVWEITRRNEDETGKYCEYRLERLLIYAEAANDLSLGVPANLFLPEE
jgi:arylsulfate sulfotransferase